MSRDSAGGFFSFLSSGEKTLKTAKFKCHECGLVERPSSVSELGATAHARTNEKEDDAERSAVEKKENKGGGARRRIRRKKMWGEERRIRRRWNEQGRLKKHYSRRHRAFHCQWSMKNRSSLNNA